MPKVKVNGDELKIDLTEPEVKWIKDTLERDPTITELGMFEIGNKKSYKFEARGICDEIMLGIISTVSDCN